MVKMTDKKDKYIIFDIKRNEVALFQNQKWDPFIFSCWYDAYDNLTENDKVFNISDIKELLKTITDTEKRKELNYLTNYIIDAKQTNKL